MRSTDVCHPYDLRVPVPRAFPVHCRSFRCADVPWSLGSTRLTRGSSDFTTVEPLRRTVIGHFVLVPSSPRGASVGVFFPRCQRCDRASDTPVATRSDALTVQAPSRLYLRPLIAVRSRRTDRAAEPTLTNRS